jgi:hypothetical protein
MSPIRSLPAVFLVVLLVSPHAAARQDTPARADSALRTFFTARSAVLDDTLGDEVRKEFADDDDSPLRSVAIDLDGDGRDEKFVLSAAPAASGGSQWLVWDPARKIAKGLVVGAIIFVERAEDDHFPRLETYWKQGGDMAIVFDYAYAKGKYVRVKSRALRVPEIDEYFRNKPPLDLDKELIEIKDDGTPDRRT